MCDGISPVDQFLQLSAAAIVPRVQGADLGPEIHSQAIEIRADSAGMRIASTQASIPDELRPQKPLKLCGDDGDNMVDALRMKVPAKALKVRRQESGIRIIDLLSRVASASFRAANHDMGVFDLVQGIDSFAIPSFQGI